jgi:hypothetical protein
MALSEEARERHRLRSAAYYKANREKCIALSKGWAERNRDRVKARKALDYTGPKAPGKRLRSKENALIRRYGITLQQRDLMLDAQGGRCALCTKDVVFKLGSAAVDHCHETGRVRGILCTGCNSAIAKLGDNVSGIERALAYVMPPK